MKNFLYLEKYKLLTKQTKSSCSNLHRSEAENMIRATHMSSQLAGLGVHLQDWTCGERTVTEKGQQSHGEMLCKVPTGGTCTRKDWATSEACRELNISLDDRGRSYDALRSMALIWSLVCTAIVALLPARRGHGCTPAYHGPLFPCRETHTQKLGRLFNVHQQDPLSGHGDRTATYTRTSMQPLGWRCNGEEQWQKQLESRDVTDCLRKYSEVAYYKVIQHSNVRSQSRYQCHAGRTHNS